MQLNCYQCKGQTLSPTKLDVGLPALKCSECDGTYIDLLSYRTWLEDFSEYIESEQASDEEIVIDELTNTETAMICQRCHKFMTKYRINHEHDNTINVCTRCDDVWLDKGEWALLKQLKIQDKLTEVMSDPWQKHILNQEEQQLIDKVNHEKFGDDFEKIHDFVQWLSNHPKRRQIKSYLMAQG